MLTQRMIRMLIITGILFGAIFSYQGFKALMIKKYLSGNKMPTVTVSAMKASYQAWQPKLRASGSLKACKGVEVTTELGGIVKNIQFNAGSEIQEGEILVELNAEEEGAKLQALEAALTLAELTYNRNMKQFKANALSKASLDADAADLKSKQAQVAEQAAIVAKKTIRAPFKGHLGISVINVGQYLNPGDQIVTLQALDPIYVDFNIPQQSLSQIATGQVVHLSIDTYPEQIFEGKITSFNPKVDPTTRNVLVQATFANPAHKLRPGMFASVEILSGKTQKYITLPQTAVSFNPYGEIAYVVKNTNKDNGNKPLLTVMQTFITVGETRGDQIAVLKGIQPDDLIVTAGQHKLKNGSHVIINNSVVPHNNPAPMPVDR
jgi:membrane fusion protein (multidrug efflux system)